MNSAQFYYLLRRGVIGGGGSASTFTGLLDTYSGAAAAYSLRQLSSTYTGNAITVRRASDNTTQNIGFVNNELDTASLETFCSGTDGFVTTWYDQSGNGYDATQTDALAQKQIVTNGNVNLSNNKPNTTNDDTGYDIFGITSGSVNACFFCVAKATTSSMLFSDQLSTPYYGWAKDADLASGWNGPSTPSQFVNGNSIGLDRNALYDGIASQGLISLFADTSTIDRNYRLGYNTSSIPFFDEFQELIIYHTDQSSNRTGIETNINSYYSIY